MVDIKNVHKSDFDFSVHIDTLKDVILKVQKAIKKRNAEKIRAKRERKQEHRRAFVKLNRPIQKMRKIGIKVKLQNFLKKKKTKQSTQKKKNIRMFKKQNKINVVFFLKRNEIFKLITLNFHHPLTQCYTYLLFVNAFLQYCWSFDCCNVVSYHFYVFTL
ncbi:hypothetical protein RFI_35972 [Reticulomyxa filosa]|uniref:Uncharacterized protein n=1 Tax=Reticulomyxa filosa TaxID=46433 RepID=X6LHP6_RETFI|nr:hypothetical protein RFI_35972 [Reticulomyxa filosa]|eukprot:ETO01468.1 hypothetical protein RFI_35972 [Reticulomyxa filosa]